MNLLDTGTKQGTRVAGRRLGVRREKAELASKTEAILALIF